MGRHSAAKLRQDVHRPLPWLTREPGPLAIIALVVLTIGGGAWALTNDVRDNGPATTVVEGGTPTDAYVPTVPPEVPSNAPPSDAFPSDAPASDAAPSGETSSQSGTLSPRPAGTIGPPVGAPPTTAARPPIPTTVAARPRPTPTRPTATARTTRPAAATVAGTYSLDVVWRGRFQASVELHNDAASQQTWTILLTYGNGITANVAAWVDGAPSPKATRTSNGWAFTAGAPLTAGGHQTLRVQFDISDQRAPATVSCTINGRACVMS